MADRFPERGGQPPEPPETTPGDIFHHSSQVACDRLVEVLDALGRGQTPVSIEKISDVLDAWRAVCADAAPAEPFDEANRL